jgi:hypothetical protein
MERQTMQLATTDQRSIDLRRLPALAKQQIDTANLPGMYKAAVAALRQCYRVDELKDIEDKHSAIAHYAKQIKDDSLRYYAERIRLRAFERIGELLSEITDLAARRSEAESCGVSMTTANRAILASHIPPKIRDKLIEQTPPISKLKMAEYGKDYMPERPDHPLGKNQWRSEGFERYLQKEKLYRPTPSSQAQEILEYLRCVCSDIRGTYTYDGMGGNYSLGEIARTVCAEDAKAYRTAIDNICAALDEFEQALPRAN